MNFHEDGVVVIRDDPEDYVDLPQGMKLVVSLAMICEHGHFHRIHLEIGRLHKEGLLHHVAGIKTCLAKEGWREPTEDEYKAAEDEAVLAWLKSLDPEQVGQA